MNRAEMIDAILAEAGAETIQKIVKICMDYGDGRLACSVNGKPVPYPSDEERTSFIKVTLNI